MLAGQLVQLRPYLPEDVPFFFELRNDVRTQLDLLALPRPNSLRRVQEWLDQRTGADDGLFFVIAPKTAARPVGFVELRAIKPVHGWGLLGICLDAQQRGHGYAREALSLAEDYARRTFGLRKIVLEVAAANAAAIKLYRSAGYGEVGTHREHFFHDGQFHDTLVMEKRLKGGA